MTENQKNIIRNFCSNPSNKEIANLFSSAKFDTQTGEIILVGETGNQVKFKIEALETGNIDFSPLFNSKEEKNDDKIEEIIMDEEEPISQVTQKEEEFEEILDEDFDSKVIDFDQKKKEKNYTLNDIKKCVDEKNINELDEILSKFAINPNTNLVDMAMAVTTVTRNTLDEAVKCVENNTNFSSNFSDYDITGKLVNEQNPESIAVNKDEICDKSFENVIVYIAAAKLKGIDVYSKMQNEAKQNYKKLFDKRLEQAGLNVQNDFMASEINENEIKEEKQMVPTLKPDTDIKKAGFADIFILTIIIMVYAAIIINLISKLN